MDSMILRVCEIINRPVSRANAAGSLFRLQMIKKMDYSTESILIS